MSSSTLQGLFWATLKSFRTWAISRKTAVAPLHELSRQQRISSEIISEENQLLTLWEKAVSLLRAYGAFILCARKFCAVIAFQISLRF